MSTTRIQPVAKKSLSQKPIQRKPKRPPGLAKLSDKVGERLRNWSRNDVHARIELGELFARIRKQLDHGDWLTWVADHLPFSARTAQQLIELHQWAGRNAAHLSQLAPLGSTKLHVLMRVSDPLLVGLLARPTHVVPSTGIRKTLERMTVSELTELVRAKDGIPDPDVATVVLDHYRSRVRSVVRAMDAVIKHRADISPHEVEELHDELLAAAVTLSDTFDLGN